MAARDRRHWTASASQAPSGISCQSSAGVPCSVATVRAYHHHIRHLLGTFKAVEPLRPVCLDRQRSLCGHRVAFAALCVTKS